MIAALELNGKSPSTVESYVREVYLVSKFYSKRPDLISEDELIRYLLHRKNVDKLAPPSMRICYSGIRFFFERVLARPWRIFALLHARRELRRPMILSREEVHQVLESAQPFHNQVYFTTVYSCGLRLHEGLYLEIGDIDTQQMMLHVHRGKGAKDRVVPLPTIQRYLGHSHIETTMVYLHLTPEGQREAIGHINQLLEAPSCQR
jgi:site-specific recombinase XerD